MVEITFNDDSAEIDLHGAEEFLAIKRRLLIPYANIEKVDDNADAVQIHLKVAGTSLTSNSYDYGRFTTNDGMGFFVMKKKEDAFAIHLRNESYKVIVLDVTNKSEVIETLRSHISNNFPDEINE